MQYTCIINSDTYRSLPYKRHEKRMDSGVMKSMKATFMKVITRFHVPGSLLAVRIHSLACMLTTSNAFPDLCMVTARCVRLYLSS